MKRERILSNTTGLNFPQKEFILGSAVVLKAFFFLLSGFKRVVEGTKRTAMKRKYICPFVCMYG